MGWGIGDLKKTNFARSIIDTVEAAKQVKEAAVSPTDFLKLPRYITGARVYLMVGGQLIGIAQNFSWTVTNGAEVITTVDSHLPYEVVPTTFSIRAQISQLIDPDESAESQGLWSTLASNPHQPNMEVSIFDKLGTNLVNIRGIPDRITNNIGAGSLATRNVSFVGYMFTHNVSQGFEPYNEEEFNKKLKSASEKVSSATGGIF